MHYHISMANIVVVDDEKMVTSAFKTLFKVEGFNDAHLFNSPKDALDYLKSETPDLIISDFIMPEMNGLEFLREAKKLHSDVSMILLTGYADKENAIKAINEIGLYKYIEKPWDNDDLIMNIKNAVERSHLIENLNTKIKELEILNNKLDNYSKNLEKIVEDRTKDLSIANNKLSGIINNCADGIVIIDSLGKILQVNPSCENLVGLSSDALIKKKIQEIAYSNSINNNLSIDNFDGEIFGLNEDNSEVLLRDYYIVNSLSGKHTPVEISFALISEENQTNISRYVGVIRDVSVQKETERLRDDFIATLTHDMRTPLLAAIQTLKYFLQGALGKLDEKQNVLLSTMLHSNEDLLGLVNALLEVYRFDSGKLELCKTVFSIKDLIEQCFAELKSLAEKKDISFKAEYINIDDSIYITADRAEIKRVIINLCANALNYTNKDGEVNILSQIQDNDFIFSVSDNGTGIPEEDIPNLFMRFSQGTTRKRSTGTGLGLYLSRQIIEAHNGKIWVDSKLGKGSEFSFLLTNVVTDSKIKERQEVNE